MTRTGTDAEELDDDAAEAPDRRDLRHPADAEEEPEDPGEDDRDGGGLEGVEQARQQVVDPDVGVDVVDPMPTNMRPHVGGEVALAAQLEQGERQEGEDEDAADDPGEAVAARGPWAPERRRGRRRSSLHRQSARQIAGQQRPSGA